VDGLGRCAREQRAETVAIPLTGDPVADRQAVMDWVRHDERMERGECPNGCGPLVTDPGDARQRDCPACGFHHASLTINVGALL
jgi:hypothetical protein